MCKSPGITKKTRWVCRHAHKMGVSYNYVWAKAHGQMSRQIPRLMPGRRPMQAHVWAKVQVLPGHWYIFAPLPWVWAIHHSGVGYNYYKLGQADLLHAGIVSVVSIKCSVLTMNFHLVLELHKVHSFDVVTT